MAYFQDFDGYANRENRFYNDKLEVLFLHIVDPAEPVWYRSTLKKVILKASDMLD